VSGVQVACGVSGMGVVWLGRVGAFVVYRGAIASYVLGLVFCV